MKLSIILVNWKSVGWLRKCLLSIYACPPRESFEILVVDNASEGECCDMLTTEFPEVRCFTPDVNLGFAGANNLAFQYSSGEQVLFLNPDTEVARGALNELSYALDALPGAGLVGARLLNTDLGVQTSCIQTFPTILNQFFDAELLRRLWPRSRFFGMRPLFDASHASAEVDCISGACMLVARNVFESAGGFSIRYFMYTEDVDLCKKIKRGGWKIYLVQTATVVHHGGSSSRLEPRNHFAAVAMRESRWRFMAMWHGSLYATAYRLTTGLNAVLRLAMLVLAITMANRPDRRARVWDSIHKWGRILRWSLWMEPWPQQGATKVEPA